MRLFLIPIMICRHNSYQIYSLPLHAINSNSILQSQPLPPAYAANEKLIKKAEQVVDKLVAIGGTDIETALKIGIQVVENNVKGDKKHQPIIIFLTDGEPTVGETNTEKIIRTVSCKW